MLLWGLIKTFVAEVRAKGLRAGLLHFVGSLRSLRFPGRTKKAMDLLVQSGSEQWLGKHEHYFHIRHKFYLSKRFTVSQRTDIVAYHYAHEGKHFLPAYRELVYGGPGLALWEARVDDNLFSIRLNASVHMRWEGDLSLELLVNDMPLQIMSFAYVDAALFGLPSGPILFITRNQKHRCDAGHALFRSAFKQTLPAYFCLASVIGVAVANSMSRVAAVSHDAQIACTDEIAQTLKNSYDEFWRAFRATELGNQAFLLPVPMATVPLSEVKAKHRRRATERRDAWGDVASQSSSSLVALRKSTPWPAHVRATHCLSGAYALLAPLFGI